MSHEHRAEADPRLEHAVAELRALIAAHYPTTTFTIGPGGENPEGIYLTARVDLDDPDAVLDLVIERVLELQLEDHLPIHVVPVRSVPRVEQLVRQRQTTPAPTFPLRSSHAPPRDAPYRTLVERAPPWTPVDVAPCCSRPSRDDVLARGLPQPGPTAQPRAP